MFYSGKPVNVDQILQTLNRHGVDYLLIGGMNFLLRHKPVLTYDVDVWVRDSAPNLHRLNRALIELGAEWGPTEKDWKRVPSNSAWLRRQGAFCLTTPQGALDVFREVRGLDGRYSECKARARRERTETSIPYLGLSDRHMLECQLALPESEQNGERIKHLRRALAKRRGQRHTTRRAKD